MTENELYDLKSIDHYTKAISYINKGKLYNAIRHLKVAKEYGYNSGHILYQMGIVKSYENNLKTALKYFNEVIEENTNISGVYYHIGNVYRIKGKNKAALENYRAALKNSNDLLIRAISLREITRLQNLDKNAKNKLIEYCRYSVKKNKNSFLNRRAEAILKMLEGNYRKAFLITRELLNEEKDNFEIYKDLAILHLTAKNYKLAIFTLKKSMILLNNDKEILESLSRCYWEIKDYNNASKVLKILCKKFPKNPVFFNNLGNVLIIRGKRVAAINAYRRALNADRNYSPSLFNLGTIYHQNGAMDFAQFYYEKAIVVDDKNPDLLYNMGILLYDMGDYTGSIRHFRKCLSINPDFEKAERNLRFIFLAKLCFPNEGPEEEITKINNFYWLALGSVFLLILFSLFKGLL